MDLTSKSTLLFILFLSSVGSASAQFTTKSIQLKPIGKSGWRYTYGIDRVKSVWSLQIPIKGLNDPEVNKYYNSFLKLQKNRGLAYLPGTVGCIAAIVTENEDLLMKVLLFSMQEFLLILRFVQFHTVEWVRPLTYIIFL